MRSAETDKKSLAYMKKPLKVVIPVLDSQHDKKNPFCRIRKVETFPESMYIK